MPKLINPAIIGNWDNWVRVYLMALIGFMAFDFAMNLLKKKESE